MRVPNKYGYTNVVLMLCVAVGTCLVVTTPTNDRGRVVQVAVAKKSLPARTVITPEHITPQQVTKYEHRWGQGSVLTLNPSQAIGRVLTVPVAEGQILTESYFIAEGSGAQRLPAIAEGMRAYTIILNSRSLPDPFLLYPGSMVDVLFSPKMSRGGVSGEVKTVKLLQGIQVLAVDGKSVVSTPGQGQEAKTSRSGGNRQVTLLVDQKQAEALQLALDNGNISLTVRNPLDRTARNREARGALLVALIPEGMRAYTVSVDSGLVPDASFLHSGSLVDILFSFRLSGSNAVGEAGCVTVLSGIQVLAVQRDPVAPKSEWAGGTEARRTAGSTQVTLLVDPKQAQALQLACDNGTISLTVRNPLDRTIGDVEVTVLNQGRFSRPSGSLPTTGEQSPELQELLAEQFGAGKDVSQITDLLKVRFLEAEYTASISSSRSSEGRAGPGTEHLRLRCEVDILDPNLVLGVSPEGVITQFENDKGKIVDVTSERLSQSTSPHPYMTPFYRPRFGAIPETVGQEEAAVSAEEPTPQGRRRPQWDYELEPSRMTFEFDPGLVGPDCKRIRHVKGYFYTLVAESIKYVEVPFEPSETWVRLTPDIEIRVREAKVTQGRYDFRIETREEERAFRGLLRSGVDLPNQLPVGREWIDKDGKPIHPYSGPRFLTASHLGGNGSGSGGEAGGIAKIRFVIAVNPSHHEVPVELEEVFLPGRPIAKAEEPTLPETEAKGTRAP